jgi:FkbM family methyltransferase
MHPPDQLPRIAFVLAATEHGSLIVNRLDGSVGNQMFVQSDYEVQLLIQLLAARRTIVGDGVVALDVGANIGTYAVPLAAAMHGWGEVVAFEPQERIFYALAGNIALNNCFNAKAIWAAVSDYSGMIDVPRLNYCKIAHFGGLSLKPEVAKEHRGISTDFTDVDKVPCVRVDDFAFARVDAIKVDVEGMEVEVLAGARETIARCRPIVLAEHFISGAEAIMQELPGYRCIKIDEKVNMLAMPEDDPLWERLQVT